MLLQLEIHDDVEPAPLGRAKMKVFGRALTGMRMGQMAQATKLIEPLV
ncbi:hypothetical protein GCM10022631_14660 [Deinococcus rubellus]|uniref:Uncharacterized protein n=1 Tax=Deinococcus rubellus TaxID=1889240 RepID=A0ABY5YIJ0_9DEIO|nr:hypothetical protein [Deinococcus rubellus]UWX64934.1 hypothetical protein N0D28_04540 [Deinococcus rubellus]